MAAGKHYLRRKKGPTPVISPHPENPQEEQSIATCPPTTESPPKKNRANAHKKSFQYRSNLRPLYELIENKKFSDGQIIELKKTPFWAFFDAFTSKKVNYGKIEKNDNTICYIMQRYFVGKKRTVTDEEIRLLFGIECGSTPLDFKYSNKPHSEFVDRHLKEVPMMTRPILKDKFDEAFKGKTAADFKDVAIILCLYVCCTLFFAGTGHSLRWGFIKYIENLDNIKQYDWIGAMRQELMSSINSKPPESVSGFVMLLPYWLCLHEPLKKASCERKKRGGKLSIPGFLKWDLKEVDKKIELDKQEDKQEEEEGEDEEKQNLRTEIEVLKAENELLKAEREKLTIDDEEKQNLRTEIEALKAENELLKAEKEKLTIVGGDFVDKVLHTDPTVPHSSEKVELGVRSKRSRKEKTKGYGQVLKAASVEMVREDPKKRKTVKWRSPLCDESEGVRLKRSPKEKTEGYEKVQIVHVDNLPSPVVKKDVKLTFPKKSKVLQHLEQKDRTTLEVMIEKETAGTIMWSSSELTVSVEHAVKMMTEVDVSDHIIQAFSDILMRHQELKAKKDRAHIFASNSWTLITGKNEHLRKTILDNKVKEIWKEDYRYFIFPMNSTGGLEGKDPFHWTVLVCDNHRKVWSYYNSLRPRKTTDPFLKDAAVVKKFIEGFSDTPSDLPRPDLSWDLCAARNSPQQDDSSLDCGVISCYVMETTMENRSVQSSLQKVELQKYRAHILNKLLNDGANSYQVKLVLDCPLTDHKMMETPEEKEKKCKEEQKKKEEEEKKKKKEEENKKEREEEEKKKKKEEENKKEREEEEKKTKKEEGERNKDERKKEEK